MESSLSLSTHHPLSNPAAVSPGPKRGPGRPPKAKPDTTSAAVSGGVHDGGAHQAQLTKKRGRPPKQAQAQTHPGPARSEERRRPGRPPKQVVPFGQPVTAAAAPEADDVGVKRPAGRPPKLSVVRAAGTAAGGAGGKPRGRPRKSALGVAARPIVKRGRGRPKGIVGGGGGGGGVAVAGKRRGRPPKGSTPRKKPRRLSGKPLGRPRKDASAARSLKFEHAKANEELTAKLELIQAKIREVVGIVRPYVADENGPLAALQELEEVAMTAPPTAPPNPPEPESGSGDLNLTAPPSEPPPPVSGPYYGVPGTFSVNLPALDTTEPLHMGGSGISIEGQQAAMGWVPSGGPQS